MRSDVMICHKDEFRARSNDDDKHVKRQMEFMVIVNLVLSQQRTPTCCALEEEAVPAYGRILKHTYRGPWEED
jgi:hypothetical protein